MEKAMTSVTRSTQHSRRCESCGEPLQAFQIGARVLHVACDCKRREYEQNMATLETNQMAATLRDRGFESGLYAGMTLTSWKDRGIEDKIHEYIETVSGTGRNWLYLHGAYGLGKTHIAVAAAREIAFRRQWSPAVIRWSEYCSKIQESWRDRSVKADWRLARGAKLLVIDDLDKKDATRWSLGQLFELIDYRYTAQSPTIFTANRSPRDLHDRWMAADGDATRAIISRIVGTLKASVQFQGRDYRLSGDL